MKKHVGKARDELQYIKKTLLVSENEYFEFIKSAGIIMKTFYNTCQRGFKR